MKTIYPYVNKLNQLINNLRKFYEWEDYFNYAIELRKINNLLYLMLDDEYLPDEQMLQYLLEDIQNDMCTFSVKSFETL